MLIITTKGYGIIYSGAKLSQKIKMNPLSTIELLPKLTKPQIAALKKLKIQTVRDLLFYFPYRYLDFSQVKNIRELKAGESVSIKVKVNQITSRFSFKSHITIAEAIVSDQTGPLKVVWFNQGYIAKILKTGDEIFLAGTPEYYHTGLQLTNPLYEKVSDFPKHTARLVPVYHLTASLYPKTLRNVIASVLPFVKNVRDELPQEIIDRQNVLTIQQTIQSSHFPAHLEDIDAAKKRLAFEEIFISQLLVQQFKLKLEEQKSFAIPFDQKLVKNFLASLPFELTPGQKKAAWEILQDMEKNIPMNRLVEGDVGSGKTLVALIAALEVASLGLQAGLMAPTEILARQHYQTIQNNAFLRGREKTHYALLSNNFALLDGIAIPKAKLQKLISLGMPGIVIGTHALISEKVHFKNLALLIVDEQHRFGVNQRAALVQGKSKNGEKPAKPKKIPHLLSLTATPIPRTLQLAYYGELSVSQIKSKPVGRKSIITKLVSKHDRAKAYQFIAAQIHSGRQAFVITPLIEESETLEVKSAKTEYESLKKIFPHFSIGLLHGKMQGKEKESVMAEFLANKIHILVSTSVVEVGVDVPNASVMLIEGSDRFGLAQLHQFRGRVGRAEHQSYCFLFTETENPQTMQRLEGFTKTNDGFALAELDLKQRGFGQIYGSSQSGWDFKFFSPAYVSLIEPAKKEALKLLQNDPELEKYPELREKIKDKVVHFE